MGRYVVSICIIEGECIPNFVGTSFIKKKQLQKTDKKYYRQESNIVWYHQKQQ